MSNADQTTEPTEAQKVMIAEATQTKEETVPETKEDCGCCKGYNNLFLSHGALTRNRSPRR